MEDDAKKYLEKFRRAATTRQLYETVNQDIYDYFMPNRQGFYTTADGQRRDEKVFDDTAQVASMEFANRMQQGIVPSWQHWLRLEPGPLIEENDRRELQIQLDQITESVFAEINESNFEQEANECFLDLVVGYGALHCVDTPQDGVRFCNVEQRRVYLETGASGQIEAIYRVTPKVKKDEFRYYWPKAQVPDGAFAGGQDKAVDVIECQERDYSVRKGNRPVYRYTVLVAGGSGSGDYGSVLYAPKSFDAQTSKAEVVFQRRFVGKGNAPLTAFRFSKIGGEDYGRGPAWNVLPTVKSLNLTFQLIYENMDQIIGGTWQAEDDGVVDPENVVFGGGYVNLYSQGGRGFSPMYQTEVTPTGQWMVEEQRHQIRKGMYSETLGPPEGTPASATEVAERMADLSRLLGPVVGRLLRELAKPVFFRVLELQKQRGMIELPEVDGKQVKLSGMSPLATAQKNEEITKFANAYGMGAQLFGPEAMKLKVRDEEAIDYLWKQWEAPGELIRSKEEIAEMMQKMAQAQAAQQQGMPPGEDGEAAPQQSLENPEEIVEGGPPQG